MITSPTTAARDTSAHQVTHKQPDLPEAGVITKMEGNESDGEGKPKFANDSNRRALIARSAEQKEEVEAPDPEEMDISDLAVVKSNEAVSAPDDGLEGITEKFGSFKLEDRQAFVALLALAVLSGKEIKPQEEHAPAFPQTTERPAVHFDVANVAVILAFANLLLVALTAPNETRSLTPHRSQETDSNSQKTDSKKRKRDDEDGDEDQQMITKLARRFRSDDKADALIKATEGVLANANPESIGRLVALLNESNKQVQEGNDLAMGAPQAFDAMMLDLD